MKRLARRIGSSDRDETPVSGRLMTERHTRDTKKATNAAAVHGTPSCHPNASTPAAPNANSVNQNDLTSQSSVGSLGRTGLSTAGSRTWRRALQVAADELFEAVEHLEIARVQQRLVRIVGEHHDLVVDVMRAQQLDEPGHLRELDVAVVVSLLEQHR